MTCLPLVVFRTMGTGILAGRDFDERDSLTAPKVAMVNEAFAAKIFGGGNPVGRSFREEGEAGKHPRLLQLVARRRRARQRTRRD